MMPAVMFESLECESYILAYSLKRKTLSVKNKSLLTCLYIKPRLIRYARIWEIQLTWEKL